MAPSILDSKVMESDWENLYLSQQDCWVFRRTAFSAFFSMINQCFIATQQQPKTHPSRQLEENEVAESGRKIATKILAGWFELPNHPIWVWPLTRQSFIGTCIMKQYQKVKLFKTYAFAYMQVLDFFGFCSESRITSFHPVGGQF